MQHCFDLNPPIPISTRPSVFSCPPRRWGVSPIHFVISVPGIIPLRRICLNRVVIFLAPFSQINLPYNLREAQFNAGLQLDGIFRLGSHYGSGDHRTATIDDIYKETIFAHPPNGQTILQFPLSLPQQPATISFSMGLEEGCSKGVIFQVRLNGQTHFEIFTDTFEWKEGAISLAAFAGQPLLLELVTDPAADTGCDWAHWADLHITAVAQPRRQPRRTN